MSPILLVCLTLVILFVAGLIKATLGFGESLFAIPLLTLVLGIQVAAPLSSLLAALITLMILIKGWQQIDFRASWQLILAAAIGVPVGVWGLRMLPEAWLRGGLGILLILVGLYYFTQPTFKAIQGASWAYLFGFVAGVLGGAYNVASPPMVVYGAMRRWSPEQFRVSLQGFFLPLSALILVSHASAGLWTAWVLQLFALSLPVIFIAFWCGSWLSQNISTLYFEKLVYGGLIIIGITLLV